MKNFSKISILIPAYKPSNELVILVDSLVGEGFASIIVVDDGSGNEFSELFAGLTPGIVLLKHPQNKGKGVALKTGLKYIYENYPNCFGVVTCDADGQHTPSDICAVAQSLLESSAGSLVLGSRSFGGDVPLRSAFGNSVTRAVFHLASGLKLRDTQTGLRAFPLPMIPQLLEISGDRYEYEMNVLLETAKQKTNIIEVDIQTVYKEDNKSSHFNTIRDSISIYGNIIKFSFSSLLCFGIDFVMLFVFQCLTKALSYEVSLLISVVCARLVSSLANYSINRHSVFKKYSKNAFVKYYMLVVLIVSANFALLSGFSLLLFIPLFWAKIITELLLFIISYNVQKKWVFKKECSA